MVLHYQNPPAGGDGGQPPPGGDGGQPPAPTAEDFEKWRNSDKAKDLNNDGEITIADLVLFFKQPPPGGDGPGQGGPPPGSEIVLEVLGRIEEALKSGELADIAIDEFLGLLPDDAAKELLERAAGDDGKITADEITRAIERLSGGPDGPGPGPGGDGPGQGGPPPGSEIVLEVLGRIEAVSYTHLTLPTNREV